MLGKDTAAAAERCINGPLCKEWVFIGFDGEDLLARGWSGALITQMSPSRDFCIPALRNRSQDNLSGKVYFSLRAAT